MDSKISLRHKIHQSSVLFLLIAFSLIGCNGSGDSNISSSTDADFDTDADTQNTSHQLSVSALPNDLILMAGETVDIDTTFNFASSGKSAASVSVRVEQRQFPNAGLDFITDMGGQQIQFDTDGRTSLSQRIKAVNEGTYEIVTTATIVDTGEIAETLIKIKVLPANTEMPLPTAISTIPAALAPNEEKKVVFSVRLDGLVSNEDVDVHLINQVTNVEVTMSDNGLNGDVTENDHRYTTSLNISTAGMSPDECYIYSVRITRSAEVIQSPNYQLCVTNFPIGVLLEEIEGNTVTSQDNKEAIADELVVFFMPGSTEDRIQTILAEVGTHLIGHIPEISLYQVKLDQPAATFEELVTVADMLRQYHEVQSVNTNLVSTTSIRTDSVFPNDPKYVDGTQKWLDWINAPDAWKMVGEKSGKSVAVIDSGVTRSTDLHRVTGIDLIKVTSAHTNQQLVDTVFVAERANDAAASDDNGHGTHVAGIIGADTNNQFGVAGVALGAPIFSYKVNFKPFIKKNRFGYVVWDKENSGNKISFVAAIVSMATAVIRHDVKVINMSIGSEFKGNDINKDGYCITAKRLTADFNAIFIAAAGNEGTDVMQVPPACPDFISVGNYEHGSQNSLLLSDRRYKSSSYGKWVDIAAPGVNVLSTVPLLSDQVCAGCDITGFAKKTGTSMASPMVAGTVSLMLAVNELLTPSVVKKILVLTASPMDKSEFGGAGKLNTAYAVAIAARLKEIPKINDRLKVMAELSKLKTDDTGLDLRTLPDDLNTMISSADNSDVNQMGDVQQALQDGTKGLDGWTHKDCYFNTSTNQTECVETTEYRYGGYSLASDGLTLDAFDFEWDANGDRWVSNTKDEPNFHLSNGGWIPYSESDMTLRFRSDGSALLNQSGLYDEQLELTSRNVSNLPIANFLDEPWKSSVSGNFSSGAIAHQWSFTPYTDVYKLEFWQEEDKGNPGYCRGSTILITSQTTNCNFIRTNNGGFAQTFDDLFGAQEAVHLENPLGVQLTRLNVTDSSGSAIIGLENHQDGGFAPLFNTTWSVYQLYGVDILAVKVTPDMAQQYGLIGIHELIYSVQDGYVRNGRMRKANTTEVDDDYYYNAEALTDILAGFAP